MRIATILFGAATIVVAAACSKIETSLEPQTRRVEFKLSSKNMPGTKISFQTDDGKYLRRWETGDEVSVLFSIGDTPYVETFHLIDGQGTATATFARENSAIPMTGNVYLRILYPKANDNGLGWMCRNIGIQYGYLDSNCDLMFFTGSMRDGVYVPYEAHSQVFYFHIPKGTKLLEGIEGEKYVNMEFSGREGTCLRYSILNHREMNMGSYEEGSIYLCDIYLVDGVLDSDFYVTMTTDSSMGESFDMKIIDGNDESKNCTYVLSRGEDKYLYHGTMYHLNQTHFTPVLSF